MKTRAAILVSLLWTVFAVNGCASGGPEPNRLGPARRPLLARVSSEENRPIAEAAAWLLLNAVRDAGSIVGAKEFVAEARALGLDFWAVGMLDRIQAVGWPEARPTERAGDRHRAALSLLRAGTSPEEVARRERLLPGELRLMSNRVAAGAELAGARGR
jgi:hypothetical protein